MARVSQRLVIVAAGTVAVLGLLLPASPAFATTQFFCASSGPITVRGQGQSQSCPNPVSVTITMYNGNTGGPYSVSATGSNGVVESYDSNIATNTANANCSGSPVNVCDLNPDSTASTVESGAQDNWRADIHSLGANVVYEFVSGSTVVYWPDANTQAELVAACGAAAGTVFADAASPSGYAITNNGLHNCWSPAQGNPYPVCIGAGTQTFVSNGANKGGTLSCSPSTGVPEFALGPLLIIAALVPALLVMRRRQSPVA